jgi:hypothetical protein
MGAGRRAILPASSVALAARSVDQTPDTMAPAAFRA